MGAEYKISLLLALVTHSPLGRRNTVRYPEPKSHCGAARFQRRGVLKDSPSLTSQEEAKSVGKGSTSLGRDREAGTRHWCMEGSHRETRFSPWALLCSPQGTNGMSSLGLHKSQLNRRLLLLIQATVKTTVPPFASWDVAWLDTSVSF